MRDYQTEIALLTKEAFVDLTGLVKTTSKDVIYVDIVASEAFAIVGLVIKDDKLFCGIVEDAEGNPDYVDASFLNIYHLIELIDQVKGAQYEG